MSEPQDQNEAACGGSDLTAELGADLTIPDFLRNPRILVAEKDDQIETLLRGINDARQLMDPIWRERMGAEQVREHVQRGLRCIDSAITDCGFFKPPND